MNVLSLQKELEWDEVVVGFAEYDVYYLSGYVKAFQINGDGDPYLFHFEQSGNEAICVLMLRDISCDLRFKNRLETSKYFDMVTPYGYGGFIFKEDPDAFFLEALKRDLLATLKKMNVVSVFFRFHPVLRNAIHHKSIVDVVDLGHTIAMDLTSSDIIWANLTSKNRNVIRKAKKTGVEIYPSKDVDLLINEFRPIYNATMEKDMADEYYYFAEEFYHSIACDLRNNYELFYAVFNNDIIAAAIMIYSNGYLNYHLSGSKIEFRSLAAGNLLLYEAAKWGSDRGMKTFHLGGGVGSGEDNLYKFKAAFNRNSNYRFSIGRLVVNEEVYSYLIKMRINDADFNLQSSFFPLYRG